MTDEEFTEYKCPLCNSINIDETLGICLDCGYDGLQDKALGYTITCNATTNGNCTVSTPYGDITDGQTCTVPFGTVITITATPDANYQFSAWAGGSASLLGSSNPVTLVVMSNISFSATMVSQKKITVGAILHGNATVNGVTVDVAGEALYYDAGTVLTLVAIPDSGYEFQTWNGTEWSEANNTTNPITITLSADEEVDLEFQAMDYKSADVVIYGDNDATIVTRYAINATTLVIKVSPSTGMALDEAVFACSSGDGDVISASENTVTIKPLVSDDDYKIILFCSAEE